MFHLTFCCEWHFLSLIFCDISGRSLRNFFISSVTLSLVLLLLQFYFLFFIFRCFQLLTLGLKYPFTIVTMHFASSQGYRKTICIVFSRRRGIFCLLSSFKIFYDLNCIFTNILFGSFEGKEIKGTGNCHLFY